MSCRTIKNKLDIYEFIEDLYLTSIMIIEKDTMNKFGISKKEFEGFLNVITTINQGKK